MRERGIETRLLAGCATPDGIAMCESHGVAVEVFGGTKDLQYAASNRFARWLAPRVEDVDVLHAHMFGAWWAAAAVRSPEVPLVASEHNAPWRRPSRSQQKKMKRALAAVDLFFAHGPGARRLVLDLGFPVERLRNGVSPVGGFDALPQDNLDSPRIVFAGRLHHEKGPDLLLRAVAAMEDPPATLILGAGPMEVELRKLSVELGIHHVTQFLGWQREPGRFIAGASALVVPSRNEAWCQAAVLAMGLGVPVIGSAVEGLPLTLGARRGLLVPPEDPVALAAVIRSVLAGRLTTDRIGAREYALRFSPERVAEVYAAAYHSLVADREPSRQSLTTLVG
jgi:glycosyltransferase involved in cell wall biosynthesis